MKIFFKFIILIMVFTSCKKDEVDSIQENEAYVNYIQLPDTLLSGEKFDLIFEVPVPDCWNYSHVEKNVVDSNLYFKVYLKGPTGNNPDAVCTTGVTDKIITEEITLYSTGNIYFFFNDSTVFDTLFVKN